MNSKKKHTRLSKAQSRERWSELRQLWREFDPIGVFDAGSTCPADEYDHYVDGSMRLLEQRANLSEICAYLRWACEEVMALSPAPDAHYERFAMRLQAWYSQHWPDTVS